MRHVAPGIPSLRVIVLSIHRVVVIFHSAGALTAGHRLTILRGAQARRQSVRVVSGIGYGAFARRYAGAVR